MKPKLYALIAVILYGISNPVLEQKLSKLNPFTLLFCECLIIFALALAVQVSLWLTSTDTSLNLPSDTSIWKWLTIFSAIVFTGHFFYAKAFTSGGDAITISLFVLIIPIAATLVSTIWTKKLPTLWHYAGYALALIAILCIVKGNSTT